VRHPFLSTVLVFVLLSPAALSWLGTALQKHAIKEGVEARLRQGMEAADLTVLAFSKKEAAQVLEWEHEREFEYQGEMYDVVQTESRGDSLFYTCFHDHAETALNRQLDQWLAQWLRHSPAQQQQGERLLCFFRSLFFMPTATLNPVAFGENRQLFYYQMPAGQAAEPLSTPPPERL
jgi:hypothetical protein